MWCDWAARISFWNSSWFLVAWLATLNKQVIQSRESQETQTKHKLFLRPSRGFLEQVCHVFVFSFLFLFSPLPRPNTDFSFWRFQEKCSALAFGCERSYLLGSSTDNGCGRENSWFIPIIIKQLSCYCSDVGISFPEQLMATTLRSPDETQYVYLKRCISILLYHLRFS